MLKNLLYRVYERQLLNDVRRQPIPRHVGLIQDGNRRYAREAGLSEPREGYLLASLKTEEVLTWCAALGIPVVTLWWLSTENLTREPDEVATILQVIEQKMAEWMQGGFVSSFEFEYVLSESWSFYQHQPSKSCGASIQQHSTTIECS